MFVEYDLSEGSERLGYLRSISVESCRASRHTLYHKSVTTDDSFTLLFWEACYSQAVLEIWLGCNLVAISFDGSIILLMLMSLGTIIPDNQRKRKFLMSIDHIIIVFLKVKSLKTILKVKVFKKSSWRVSSNSFEGTYLRQKLKPSAFLTRIPVPEFVWDHDQLLKNSTANIFWSEFFKKSSRILTWILAAKADAFF